MRRGVAIVLVVALVGAGIVAGYAAGRLQAPEPDPADQEAPLLTVPVEYRTLRDTVSVAASMSHPVVASVRGRGGTVTRMPRAGSTVQEGDVVGEVDLRPVVALSGSRPMFRALQWGATGEDVRQLEAALERLGHDPGPVDGFYTASTRHAWHALAEALGYDVDGDVRAADVVFVEDLPARLGTVVAEPGEPADGVLAELVAISAEVTATVGSDVASRLAPGMPAQLRGPLLPEPVASEIGEVRVSDEGAELLLAGDFEGLQATGLRVTVDLTGEQGEGMVVPSSALRTHADGSVYVHVVHPDGTRPVEVEVVASTGTEAQVRGALSPGEEIDVGG